MRTFVIAPGRAYGLDVVVPILYQLKEQFPKLKIAFIFYHKKEFDELCKNRVLFDHVANLGSVVKAHGSAFLEARMKKLNRFIKMTSLLPTLLQILCSRRSVVLIPRRVEAFIDRLITKINSLSGKTFCYLMATTSLEENSREYIDENGNRRANKRPRPAQINVGDGLLAYHKNNLRYLEFQGYKDNILIGYPMMYPAFQRRINERYRHYLVEEIGLEYSKKPIVTVFLNKYYGRTSGQGDEWAKDRFCEAVAVIRRLFPDSYILVRAHPVVPSQKVDSFIQSSGVGLIKHTFLHIHVLACASRVVISIAQSSSGFHALAFGAPVIDYGRIGDEFYELFPAGSLYSDFGVQVAFTPEELKERINEVTGNNRRLQKFQAKLDHKMNLDVFTGYWNRPGLPKQADNLILKIKCK